MEVNAINNVNQTNFKGFRLNQKSLTNTLYASLLSASMLSTAVATDSFTKTKDKQETNTELQATTQSTEKQAQMPWGNKKFTGDVNEALGLERDSNWGMWLVFGLVGVAYIIYNKMQENK